MDSRKNLAAEWFERGKHDYQIAKMAHEADGPGDTISVLLQQSAEKYLKGYLISQGWKLKKTHNIVELLDEAMIYDPAFSLFLDLGRTLTAYYVEDRYPPGASVLPDPEEIGKLLKLTVKLIGKITHV